MTNKQFEELVELFATRLCGIENAITPRIAQSQPGEDASGGYVASVAEAVMGVTKGLCRIADTLKEISESLDSIDQHFKKNA